MADNPSPNRHPLSSNGFLTLPGGPIEYHLYGVPSGTESAELPVIVLLHEALGSVSQWGNFPAALAAHCALPVFVYSRPGHGRSGPVSGDFLPDYLIREAVEILPAVLAGANIKNPILFGHSDGATIALLYAAAFTSPIDAPRAVIAEAPHVFVEDMTVKALTLLGQAAEDTALLDRLSRHHEDAAGVFWRWHKIWLSPDFRPWNITEMMSAIRCPVFLIQGEGDEYASLDQITAISRAVRGNRQTGGGVEELILADCGHSPHRDQKSAVLTATQGFLQRI